MFKLNLSKFYRHIIFNSEKIPNLSFSGVIDGRVESVLGDAESLSRNPDSSSVQRLHRDLETHPGLTQQMII